MSFKRAAIALYCQQLFPHIMLYLHILQLHICLVFIYMFPVIANSGTYSLSTFLKGSILLVFLATAPYQRLISFFISALLLLVAFTCGRALLSSSGFPQALINGVWCVSSCSLQTAAHPLLCLMAESVYDVEWTRAPVVVVAGGIVAVQGVRDIQYQRRPSVGL